MEFESWREWTSSEVAFFISTFCELPQYAIAIGQNISGQALQRLSAANMLTKGLARAGVCDWDHQRLIAIAVGKLETFSSDELTMELNLRLQEGVTWRPKHRRPAPPNTARGAHRPKRRQIEVDLRLWDLEAMNSARSMSPTAAGMQRPSTAEAHIDSLSRSTPRPWNHYAVDSSRRAVVDGSVEHTWSSQAGAAFSKRLREQLAANLREYEIMGQSVDPLYATVSPRIPRPKEVSCRPLLPQHMFGKMVDSSSSTGRRPSAPVSTSEAEDRGQPSARTPVPKTASLPGTEGIFKPDSTSGTIGHASTSKDRNEMMQGLLGSQGAEDLAVGTGLQAVQKIQAQRHHEKESTAVHECGSGTLETLTNVLHTAGGSGDGLEMDQRDQLSRQPSVHSLSPDKKLSRHSTLSSPDKIKAVTARVSGSFHDEEHKAAVKVQSCHRQRQAMREAELRRHNKKTAEIKHFQEHHTAEHAQQQLQRKKEESEKKVFDEQLKATTKIQAIHRGNLARSSYYEKHHKERGTQDAHKGQTSPAKRHASHASEETAAATSIQATFRGNRDRKSSTASNCSNSSRKSTQR